MCLVETVETSAPLAAYPLGRRVVDTFVAPGRLFEHFRAHTPWVGPLLIAIAAGLLIVFVIPHELYVEQARETIRRTPVGTEMPSAETLAGFARAAGAASVVFGAPIAAFVLAGILTLVFSVLGGGDARYVQYLAVATHTMLISALGGLVALPVQLMTGNLEARLSLGLLAPFLEPGSFAAHFFNGLDIFGVWAIVVTGLGVHVVNRRPSWGVATAILLGLYLAVLAIMAGIAS
jgi:hypothetical protein